MTDYPRFRVAQSVPDNAFMEYFGARQVELVLLLADAWLRWRISLPRDRLFSRCADQTYLNAPICENVVGLPSHLHNPTSRKRTQ